MERPVKRRRLIQAMSGGLVVGVAGCLGGDDDTGRLHEIIVELVVELMEHAISHAEDDGAISEFETQMLEFDIGEFVEQYRAQRNFESEHDQPM